MHLGAKKQRAKERSTFLVVGGSGINVNQNNSIYFLKLSLISINAYLASPFFDTSYAQVHNIFKSSNSFAISFNLFFHHRGCCKLICAFFPLGNKATAGEQETLINTNLFVRDINSDNTQSKSSKGICSNTSIQIETSTFFFIKLLKFL